MKKADDRDQDLETMQGRLSMLCDAVLRINENLNFDNVLQEVVDSARALIDARYGVITFLTDTPRDYRVSWARVGEHFPMWVDSSGNAFPTTCSYTVTGLDPGVRYKVRVRARYDGYSGGFSDIVEVVVASAAPTATPTDMGVPAATPTDTPLSKAVGAVSVVSNQPGEFTVSWDAPDDSGQPHDLFTSGMNAAEHQRLEETPERVQFFAYLNKLSQPLRIPDSRSQTKAQGLPEFLPLPVSSFLAAPIRHQGIGVGSIYLAREREGQEFSQEDEELLALFAAQAALAIANARRYREGQQARANLETVIDTSQVGVAVFNVLSGDPLSLNREAMRIIQGLDLSNRPLKELLKVLTVRWADGQEMSLAEFVIAQALHDGGTLRAEQLVLSGPDGRSITVLVNATPMRSEHGDVNSLVVTIQDMTPLEELEKLRAEFLGMVSHELRTPLTSITGSAVTLRESLNTMDPAEMVQYVRIIETQANRMRDLISELLDVARIETGSLSVTPEPAEVAVLVDEARNTFLSGGGRDNVSIDLETTLPWVMADKRRIVQVLGNLLSNAARYSHEPSLIRVSAALDDGYVAVSVADEGRGVSPERIPYLFRKFTRINGDEGEREITGSGLGLAICKGIVEAHGGRIWAESGGPGLGTQFTFTLPLVEEEVGGAAREPSLHSRRPEPSEREQMRILAVDDDPQTLRYVRDVLSKAGYVPIVTGNPDEVLDLVKTDQPHLVLLDLMLPGRDGIELMKSILDTAEVPVIFLSVYSRDEIIANALESGAADYMVKPFSPTELVARVGAAMRRRLVPVPNEPSEPFVLGDLTVDYAERRVSIAGRPVRLTVTEYKLLLALSINAGRVLTHTELLQQVWDLDRSGDRSVVRTFVRRLRRKLGDDANNPAYIFAEPRVGYRMPKG